MQSILSQRQIWQNLGGLGLLTVLLGLVDWQHTGPRAVLGLIEDLHGDDVQAQALAAMHLGHIGPAARPAIPALLTIATASSSSYPRTSAAGALPTIDLSAARQAMAVWLPRHQDSNPQTRRDAAATLSALGPVAKPAVPALVMFLKDQGMGTRERATRALGSISLPIDAIMRGLIEALRDPEWTVRYAAVTQFSFSGFSSPESLAVLHDLTKDSNQTVARSAQSAVATAERPMQVSVYSLMLNQGTNRTYTLHQLAKLGPHAAGALSGIASILTAEQPLERYLAACALEEIGLMAKVAATALQRTLQDTDPIVREAAGATLQSIENKKSQTP